MKPSIRKTSDRRSTRDAKEIAHFAQTSIDWWDTQGPFAPLHRLTSTRMRFLKSVLPAIKDQKILDVGCGGGLMCEPLARLGAKVTGIDADNIAISVATQHAAAQNLPVNYIHGAAEDLLSKGDLYDVVTALEIIEHVTDPLLFVEMTTELVRPGGTIVYSTLNRNWKSYALGIIAAERILKWVPEGTHDWKKFIKPSELARMIASQGFAVQHVMGVAYNPLKSEFQLAQHDLDVNYFMVATRPMKG